MSKTLQSNWKFVDMGGVIGSVPKRGRTPMLSRANGEEARYFANKKKPTLLTRRIAQIEAKKAVREVKVKSAGGDFQIQKTKDGRFFWRGERNKVTGAFGKSFYISEGLAKSLGWEEKGSKD